MTLQPTVVIRGNRVRLLVQAVLTVAAAAAIGVGLQRFEPISRSPLGSLDNIVPGPLVFLVVTGVGVAIAVAIVKDSWSHRIDLREDDFQISTGQGRITLPYSAVAIVRALPAYGVGIGLRDPDTWLAQIAADPGAPPRQRPISEFLRTTWGIDIAILQKNLDRDSARVVELLQARTGPTVSED